MFDKIPKNVQRLIQSFQIIITIIEVRSKRGIQKCNGRMIVTNQFNEVIHIKLCISMFPAL